MHALSDFWQPQRKYKLCISSILLEGLGEDLFVGRFGTTPLNFVSKKLILITRSKIASLAYCWKPLPCKYRWCICSSVQMSLASRYMCSICDLVITCLGKIPNCASLSTPWQIISIYTEASHESSTPVFCESGFCLQIDATTHSKNGRFDPRVSWCNLFHLRLIKQTIHYVMFTR